uniref:C-type lectin domain-containing protein n=1 Tax=Stomoxys calcitrans TaxID=35570 RepID=A0A1I8PWF5_STOCA
MKLLVLVLGSLIAWVSAQAVQKWQKSEDGSLYYIENERKFTWFGSWNECARKNMSLVAIDSYKKHMQVDSLLRKLYGTGPGLWIGGNDNDLTDRYEWYATGEIFTLTYWGPAQPKRGVNHCILIWEDFKWHDWPCTNKLGFVCEENRFLKQKSQEVEALKKELDDKTIAPTKFRNFIMNINPTFDHVVLSGNESVLVPNDGSVPIK